MSTRIGSLINPVNRQAVYIYKGFSWPCLFLGPIWFLVKGMWMWAILALIITIISSGLSFLVFPFFANGLYVKKLRSQGYLSEEEIKEGQALQAGTSAALNSSLGMSVPPVQQPGNYYISRNGENLGPYTENYLREQLLSGVFTAEDHAWREGEESWKPLGQLLPPLTATPTVTKGGVSLVFAKLDDGISWKNEYDIFDAKTGQMFSQIREGEVGGLTKVARMGDASVNSKFDVMFKSPDGTAQFRCRNKGLTGSTCEILSPEGAILGEVKTEMGFQMKSTLTETGGGNVYKTKGNGVGVLCTKHEITKNGKTIGKIEDINESEARTIFGSQFGSISTSRKYDYGFHLSLNDSQENLPLIMSRIYLIAHTSGV